MKVSHCAETCKLFYVEGWNVHGRAVTAFCYLSNCFKWSKKRWMCTLYSFFSKGNLPLERVKLVEESITEVTWVEQRFTCEPGCVGVWGATKSVHWYSRIWPGHNGGVTEVREPCLSSLWAGKAEGSLSLYSSTLLSWWEKGAGSTLTQSWKSLRLPHSKPGEEGTVSGVIFIKICAAGKLNWVAP